MQLFIDNLHDFEICTIDRSSGLIESREKKAVRILLPASCTIISFEYNFLLKNISSYNIPAKMR